MTHSVAIPKSGELSADGLERAQWLEDNCSIKLLAMCQAWHEAQPKEVEYQAISLGQGAADGKCLMTAEDAMLRVIDTCLWPMRRTAQLPSRWVRMALSPFVLASVAVLAVVTLLPLLFMFYLYAPLENLWKGDVE